jgi:hypothetical protein
MKILLSQLAPTLVGIVEQIRDAVCKCQAQGVATLEGPEEITVQVEVIAPEGLNALERVQTSEESGKATKTTPETRSTLSTPEVISTRTTTETSEASTSTSTTLANEVTTEQYEATSETITTEEGSASQVSAVIGSGGDTQTTDYEVTAL